jgi:hypothetical protein
MSNHKFWTNHIVHSGTGHGLGGGVAGHVQAYLA